MLESIKINNLAIIDKSSISFGEGFNVLTGETGAGKSLIVDALLFLTGVRADKTLIAPNKDFARVEGVFSVDANNSSINEILSSVGLENDGTLIISRTFNLFGKNECRINGELVTLNIIKKLSAILLDIFGQNDSQILLDSANHLSLLDGMFEESIKTDKQLLSESLLKLNQINRAIIDLGGLDRDREKNIEFIKFQINEIDSSNLSDGDEEDLKTKISIMQNSEKIYTALENISPSNENFSIDGYLKNAISSLSSIEGFDSDYSGLKERLYSVRYEMQDILSTIDDKKQGTVYSEKELDNLEDRLMQIKDLERKYGSTIAEILSYRQSLNDKLQKLLNADEELERLKLDKESVLKEILQICLRLHDIRKNNAKILSENIIKELKELGMNHASFDVNFKNEINLQNLESCVNESGADSIEFLFSANKGIELRPLDKIISGGEMSRFMLAFKSLQNVNSLKTCIFDEIDTGIGGEIGVEIGKKICKISSTTQVICITHLAQIASFGDNNFKIEKTEDENFTTTSVRLLNSDEVALEIARMLGNSTSSTAIANATEMLDSARGYKAYIKS